MPAKLARTRKKTRARFKGVICTRVIFMTNALTKKLEKELLSALSNHRKTEHDLAEMAKKYRTAIFGSGYKNPEPVGDICSFCAKAEKDIEQFVFGASSRICNECIDLSYEVIHEQKK